MAHLQKRIFLTTGTRGIQVVGLFIAGLLFGHSGIHKSEERMVHYAGEALLYGLLIFTVFFCAVKVVLLYEIAPISKSIRTLFGALFGYGIYVDAHRCVRFGNEPGCGCLFYDRPCTVRGSDYLQSLLAQALLL